MTISGAIIVVVCILIGYYLGQQSTKDEDEYK